MNICRAAFQLSIAKFQYKMRNRRSEHLVQPPPANPRPSECQQRAQLSPHTPFPLRMPHRGVSVCIGAPSFCPSEKHKFCFSSLLQSQMLRTVHNCATEDSRNVAAVRYLLPRTECFQFLGDVISSKAHTLLNSPSGCS